MRIRIAYLDGPRLARSMFAASEWVAAGRDEINRINVFPVPDGDTGTNLSLTLRAVADALQALGDASLPDTARTMARAAVLGARGNSGMMLANYLLGIAESFGTRSEAGTRDLAVALRNGYERVYDALDEPREGTILTVAREIAAAAERVATDSPDLATFVTRLHQEGEVALAGTPELLASLKEAGVVDAGGKGFVLMFEGVVRVIQGDPILPTQTTTWEDSAPAALVDVAEDRDYQFCTEVIVEGEQLPSTNEARTVMHGFGGSVVVVSTGDILKAHVHTDTPDAVFTAAARWGRVTFTKADDMRLQHLALQERAHVERRAVAIVSDTAADLSDSILDRHRIALVPLQVTFGDRTFKDRLELKTDQFYVRLRQATELPTTSQPAPGEFVKIFRSGLEEADSLVVVLVSGVLSGTFNAGQTAARVAGLTGLHFVDSRSASLGQGLLVLRGAELAEEGWPADAIVAELERLKHQAGMFLTVDTYENLLRSGRVSRGRAWLAGMLDVKPVISLDQEGRLVPIDRARGREAVLRRVLQLLDQRLTPRPHTVRFGVVHADAPEVAERVRSALIAAFQPKDCLVAQASGVLGTHAGIGAWAVFYQIEDGTPIRAPAGVHG